jgi:hypothetical protein
MLTRVCGAKLVCQARQEVFQMAEVAVPRELLRAILEVIQVRSSSRRS